MIAHKKLHFLFLGVIILLCMVIPVSASPSLEDAYITYSLKAYFTSFAVTFTRHDNGYIKANGSYQSSDSLYSTDSYVSVSPGDTVFVCEPDGDPLRRYPGFCVVVFYDSNYSQLSYSNDFVNYNLNFVTVPSGASYIRVSWRLTSNVLIIVSPTPATADNYLYLWTEIDDITMSNGVIQIPYSSGLDYSQIWLDFQFDDVDTYFNFNLDVYSYFVGFGETANVYPSGTYISLYSYFINSDGEKDFNFIDDSVNNPVSFSELSEFGYRLSGFRLYIPIMENVSSGFNILSVQLSNFFVGDEAAYYEGELENLVDEKEEQVSAVISDLTLPTPNINGALSGLEELSTAYHNSEVEIISVFHGIYDYIPIVGTFMLLSISMTVLGYILFGKSG